MRKTTIGAMLLITSLAFGQHDSSPLFTQLLNQYVHDGKVNYPGLCKDQRLGEYITQLSVTNPDVIADRNTRLAFWINAYNAYTLKVICDHYPIKSINELHSGGLVIGTVLHKTIWDKDFVIVNNSKTTLNHIEHKIIRPEFKEPRAHFALVCASKSCPSLRSEAYQGSSLDIQLNDQARIFFGDPTKNYFEVERKKAHLSRILDWYSKDFGNNDHEVLLFVSQFLPDSTASSIRADPDQWKIEYMDYDWSLNE